VRALATEEPAPRDDRHATALLHDEPNARVVAFRLLPGQRVAPHSSASTVIVHVTAGEGLFTGQGEARTLRAGETAVYAPGETHAIDAGEAELRFLAIIAPRPGG
jgi:quercetin dioxygenase-like cupin family protein